MYEYRRLTPQQQAEVVTQRLAKGFPPHSPPHNIRDRQFYLISATCYEHQNYLSLESRRQQLLDRFFNDLMTKEIGIRAWIILPNHYHLLTIFIIILSNTVGQNPLIIGNRVVCIGIENIKDENGFGIYGLTIPWEIMGKIGIINHLSD